MPDSTTHSFVHNTLFLINIFTNHLEGIFGDFIGLIWYFLLQDFRSYIYMHLFKYWDPNLQKQIYMLVENETVIL